jgi:hypothetical protein
VIGETLAVLESLDALADIRELVRILAKTSAESSTPLPA